jgi:hypothetical protein
MSGKETVDFISSIVKGSSFIIAVRPARDWFTVFCMSCKQRPRYPLMPYTYLWQESIDTQGRLLL